MASPEEARSPWKPWHGWAIGAVLVVLVAAALVAPWKWSILPGAPAKGVVAEAALLGTPDIHSGGSVDVSVVLTNEGADPVSLPLRDARLRSEVIGRVLTLKQGLIRLGERLELAPGESVSFVLRGHLFWPGVHEVCFILDTAEEPPATRDAAGNLEPFVFVRSNPLQVNVDREPLSEREVFDVESALMLVVRQVESGWEPLDNLERFLVRGGAHAMPALRLAARSADEEIVGEAMRLAYKFGSADFAAQKGFERHTEPFGEILAVLEQPHHPDPTYAALVAVRRFRDVVREAPEEDRARLLAVLKDFAQSGMPIIAEEAAYDLLSFFSTEGVPLVRELLAQPGALTMPEMRERLQQRIDRIEAYWQRQREQDAE